MCTMSVVMDYGRQRIPQEQWTRPVWNEYKEILERLDALDKKLGEPECHDPEKAEWMEAVERRLQALEEAANNG